MISSVVIAPVAAWVIGAVCGVGAATAIWLALRTTFEQPLFLRTNHRGRQVPVSAGIVLVLAAITVAATWRFFETIGGHPGIGSEARTMTVLAAAGFGLLGLFDDLGMFGDDRGFRGHVGALVRGRLTTGGVKLLGGGFLAVMVTPTAHGFIWWRVLLGAAVIALAANTANLFDRAPARCIKGALLWGVVLFATCDAAARPSLGGVAIVLGAAIGLMVFDAREQLMLGDAGSNVLGAVLGWGVVATTGWVTQVVVLAALVALNIVSERVSFSKVIDGNRVLRAIDRFGRSAPDT